MTIFMATVAFAVSNLVEALKIDAQSEAFVASTPTNLGPIFDYGDNMAQEDEGAIIDPEMLLAQDHLAAFTPDMAGEQTDDILAETTRSIKTKN